MFKSFIAAFLLLPVNPHYQLFTNHQTIINKYFDNKIIITQNIQKSPKFAILENNLKKAGFEVILALPPKRGAYGLLQVSTKKIWINPVVFELNIALPTLIHESVHASQVCAGNGEIKALGLDLMPMNQARPFFERYPDIHRKDLEREAYTVQTQPNSFDLALSLLKKYCQLKN
ncbi:MAG: hypothetical protein WBM32_16280 [Crocosphaera sp.]